MTTYQFEVDDDVWDDWKQTVPRSKSLQQRIIELLEADAEGRVRQGPVDHERDDGPTPVVEHATPAAGPIDEVVETARAAWADDPDARRQARVDSLRAALESVKDEPLSKSELQAAAYPDSDDLGQNERTWFRKTVKPYLQEVAEYSNSDHQWHYSG